MKRFTKKKWAAAGLVAALILVCVAGGLLCRTPQEAAADDGLMEGVTAEAKEGLSLSEAADETAALTDFGVRLFATLISQTPQENMLLSPLSVAEALGMAACGAKNETKAQLEEVLGMDAQTLSQYLYSYMEALPQGEAYKLTDANSIWIRNDEDVQVEQEFLQTNADWYGAGAYLEDFDDATVEKINAWVEKNTDGMIDQIIEEIPDEAVLYLINALVFDAEWETVYLPYQVREQTVFTAADGAEETVSMMYGAENLFLEDELATGFIKYYKNRSYAFVALLPNEGISTEEYIGTLTGAHVQELLENPTTIHVDTGLPVYKTETALELKDALYGLGMTDAFDGLCADFSGMASAKENIFISSVLHKTYIEVDTEGTRAAAVTEIEAADGSTEVIEYRTVILNRPFVYMIIDCEQKLPVFIGVMNHGE